MRNSYFESPRCARYATSPRESFDYYNARVQAQQEAEYAALSAEDRLARNLARRAAAKA